MFPRGSAMPKTATCLKPDGSAKSHLAGGEQRFQHVFLSSHTSSLFSCLRQETSQKCNRPSLAGFVSFHNEK